MKRLLLVPFVLLAFSSSAFAEADPIVASRAGTTSTREVRAATPARKWYAGGAVGLAYLTGWDTKEASDAYYQTYGYSGYNVIPHGWIWAIVTDFLRQVAFEGKIYGGYRPLNFLDVELGYAGDYGWSSKNNYKNYTTGDTIESYRRIKARALYVSTSIRPLPEGYGHGLYFKLGGHISDLNISKTVTGTPANLDTIASGDRLPGDGTSRGHGALFGLGYDFKTARFGDVRLEWSHYSKLGGTPYGKSSLNVGYHASF